MHFGDRNDIDTKNRLAVLMRNHRFHGKDLPTQKQLDSAWEHLKHIGVIQKERPVYKEKVVVRERVVRQRRKYYTKKKYVHIIPKGFKKTQIRDKKTGRIVAWEKPTERLHYVLNINEISIIPKGFKKTQIRDKKTGRIIKWV